MAVYICKMCGAALTVPDGSSECTCEFCGTHQTIQFDAADLHSRELNNALKRGRLSLEDHEWKNASVFFENALNIDPHCAEAYWGKFLAANKLTVSECLDGSFLKRYENDDTEWIDVDIEKDPHVDEMVSRYTVRSFLDGITIRNMYLFKEHYFSELGIYKKQRDRLQSKLENDKSLKHAVEFAGPELKAEIDKCSASLIAYMNGRVAVKQQEDDEKAAKIRQKYLYFRENTDKQVVAMNADALRKREAVYQECVQASKKIISGKEWKELQQQFVLLGDYKDSRDLFLKIQAGIEDRRQRLVKELQTKKFIKANWKKASLLVIVICLLITKWIIPQGKYDNAKSLFASGEYQKAASEFKELGNFSDSKKLRKEAEAAVSENSYNSAMALMDEGRYESAIQVFTGLKKYKDSPEKIIECQNAILKRDYETALGWMDDGDFDRAISIFTALGDYEDSAQKIIECENEKQYKYAETLAKEGNYPAAAGIYLSLGEYKQSAQKLDEAADAFLRNILLNKPEEIIRDMGEFEPDVFSYLIEKIDFEVLSDLICNVEPSESIGFISRITYKKKTMFFNYLEKSGKNVPFDWNMQFRMIHVNVQPGDTILLGSYEQDNNFANGAEPIEWLVLENDGKKLFLISKDALELARFDEIKKGSIIAEGNWESCLLRQWLNGSFYDEVFTDDERSLIMLSSVETEPNPRSGEKTIVETQDYLFLLSLEEAERYFLTDEDRQCKVNLYIKAKLNPILKKNTEYARWWLRTSGPSNYSAATVDPEGKINKVGQPLSPVSGDVAVRPVFAIGL